MDRTDLRHTESSVIALRIAVSLLWAIYSVCVFTGYDKAYNFLSPVTAIAAMILALKSYRTIGEYKWTGLFFMSGFIFWVISDILVIIYTYFVRDCSILIIITDKLYMMPQAMFCMAVCDYTRVSFRRTDFTRMMADAFVLAFLVFILSAGMFGATTGMTDKINIEMLGTTLYFFIVLFTLCLQILIIFQTGLLRHTKAWYMMGIAVLVYSILEVRYTYYMNHGMDAESVYLDIIYLDCIAVISIALSDPTLAFAGGANSDHPFMKISFRTGPFAVWINSILVAGTGLILFVKSVLSVTEIYIVLIVALAYIVIQKSMESRDLYVKLLEAQQGENKRLSELVDEKTHELREANSRLSYISTVDELTGLYNRRYCSEMIKKLTDEGESFTVFAMDLNRFKPINDNYGHDMGDFVLKEVERRLQTVYSDVCSAYRMGGDEFMIILHHKMEGDADIALSSKKVADAICEACDIPVEARAAGQDRGTVSFAVSVSCGAATFPEQTGNTEELLRFADSAMYSVKHKSEKSACKFYGQ